MASVNFWSWQSVVWPNRRELISWNLTWIDKEWVRSSLATITFGYIVYQELLRSPGTVNDFEIGIIGTKLITNDHNILWLQRHSINNGQDSCLRNITDDAWLARMMELNSTVNNGDLRTRPKTSNPFNSVGLIALFVLAGLSAILGLIYAYIYYTRINPRSARQNRYSEQNGDEDPDGKITHTHMFLFRKWSTRSSVIDLHICLLWWTDREICILPNWCIV